MYCHSEKKFKPAETLYISKLKNKQTNKHVNIERGKTKSPQIHDVTEGVFGRFVHVSVVRLQVQIPQQ